MSSDFLEWLDDDEKGASVNLTMRASGYAWLYIHAAQEEDALDYQSAKYTLPPNEKGWKAAEMIAGALLEWARHTKSIHQNAEGANDGQG